MNRDHTDYRDVYEQETKNGSGNCGAYKTPDTKEEIMEVRPSRIPSLTAIMGAKETEYNNEVFSGATINSLFASVKLNLDYAIIEQDVTIDVMCMFGGVEILVPGYLNVVVDSTPIMGGVSNKVRKRNVQGGPMTGCPTIYIRATCICGGVEIK